MRKSMIASLMLLVGALCLQGCPPVTPSAPVAPVAVQTTNEVVAVAEVTPQLGGFVLDIDLLIAQTQKGYGPLSIIDTMKLNASTVEVELFQLNGELYKSFSTAVIDGQAQCPCYDLMSGDYQIAVSIRDLRNYLLFYGLDFVTVRSGEVSAVTIAIKPLDAYPFNFIQPGLPGTYGDVAEQYRHTVVTERNGRVSQAWWHYREGDDIYFTAALPLNFSGGEMIVTDITGTQYPIQVPPIPAMIDWSTFQFSMMFVVNSNTGTLNVGVSIDDSAYTDPVDENGKKLPTLKVTTATENTVDVVFSANDYECADGFWYPAPHPGYYDGSFIITYVVDPGA